jgi:hypothetical protein
MQKRLSAVLLCAIAMALSAAAKAEDVEFTKKPKVMGNKISTVTSYRLQATSGTIIHCSATCFSDGITRHWQCEETPPDIIHCSLSCNPPKGRCLPE